MSHLFVCPCCQFLEWFCSGPRAFSRLSCIEEPSSGCLEMLSCAASPPVTNHPWFSDCAKCLLHPLTPRLQPLRLYLVACP